MPSVRIADRTFLFALSANWFFLLNPLSLRCTCVVFAWHLGYFVIWIEYLRGLRLNRDGSDFNFFGNKIDGTGPLNTGQLHG